MQVKLPKMDARRRRQAENEMLFRSINERIEDLSEEFLDRGEGGRAYDFVCECQNTECTVQVALTVAEYEAVRESGRQFIVAPSPDHVDMAIENVVDMSTRYWVVEKTDESGEIAEADDPREP
jgi:hypothetical protein